MDDRRGLAAPPDRRRARRRRQASAPSRRPRSSTQTSGRPPRTGSWATIVAMILDVRAVGPFFKNGFVVGCERTREAVIIDPGDEVAELIDLVKDRRLAIKYILLTHAHIDHVTGVAAAKRAFGVPIHLH